MKIDFVAPPFAGHLNPLVPLAEGARAAGHTVRFLTGERKVAVLAGRGLAAESLASTAGGRLEAIANPPRRVGSDPLRLIGQLRENLALLPAIRAELVAAWRRERPDLVVADSVAPVAGLVCEELGIPWITTIATPFAMETRTGTPTYLGGWRPGSPLRDAAGRWFIRGFKQSVAWALGAYLRPLGLRRLYREDGTEAIYSARAILGFGISELEFAREWPAAFEMIGPVITAPEEYWPLEFPEGRPRVLVTLGTHLLWAKERLVETVERLAAELPEVWFVVSLGDAAASGERRAGRVWTYPFVPYERDLGQFDAVVHHGGAGVTYAAILAGVPSVVVPHDYDQFDFAARIEAAGVGVRVRSLAEAGPVLRRVPDRAAIAALQAAARRYRPAEAFLRVVARVEAERSR